MLIQSHLDDIHLLAALPDSWKEGNVSGLKARGDFEIGIQWKNHRLTTATVKSLNGGLCRLRTARPVKIKGILAESKQTKVGYVTSFTTQKGATYAVSGL
ncbi:glycoside hydrolase family 95-like protein [Spirosoma telluris]|uniref:glycoside hydrolase family 95-like protein n=1 Tax=Spirosoma telluris TaxID=2183553 RepID=UPI002FC2811A